jgi:TRAP-type C4-dicarboxylate transport system substrate-binding protein
MRLSFKGLTLTTATLLVAGLGSIQLSEAKTRLVVNCFWPPQHFVCQKALPNWLEEVERVTDGRVVGIIPPKSVAAPPEQLSAVEKGIADVSVQFNGLIQNRVIGPLVAMNPFISSDDPQAMSTALWETNRKFFPDEFDSVHLLSQWVISAGELYSQTDTPVNSMEDLQSRKIWALPGTLAAVMKKIGAGVVATPAVKSNEIISRGVVDAHIGLDPQGVRAFQLIPYTKSMTKFSESIYTTSFSLIINNDKWAEISETDQIAITEVSGETFARMVAGMWKAATLSALGTFEEKGLPIVPADPAFEAALKEAAEFATADWLEKANAAGIDAQGAYDFYTSRVRELSK